MNTGWLRSTQDGGKSGHSRGQMLEIKEGMTDEIVSMYIITQEDLRFIHLDLGTSLLLVTYLDMYVLYYLSLGVFFPLEVRRLGISRVPP